MGRRDKPLSSHLTHQAQPSRARGAGADECECFHPDTQTYDIVHGFSPIAARAARTSAGGCGLQGKLFTPTNTWKSRTIDWFLFAFVAIGMALYFWRSGVFW
jgi:hypothetical protein